MKEILDIYSDYLLSSFGQTTATGLSQLLGGDLSHDQITRRLGQEKLTPKAWWQIVKPLVRQVEAEDGVLIFDDSISEKQRIAAGAGEKQKKSSATHTNNSKKSEAPSLKTSSAPKVNSDVTVKMAKRVVKNRK